MRRRPFGERVLAPRLVGCTTPANQSQTYHVPRLFSPPYCEAQLGLKDLPDKGNRRAKRQVGGGGRKVLGSLPSSVGRVRDSGQRMLRGLQHTGRQSGQFRLTWARSF